MSPFEPFLDAEDLSACVEGSDTPASLNARAESLGCSWPLWLEPGQRFDELFLCVRATPRGFRHGWVADNVLGLRWSLPSGRTLDLGGRAMKNVTGFDLVRFFAGTRGRFGRPTRLVLRLRPKAEAALNLRLSGTWERLKALARSVRLSPWTQVLERCDLGAGRDADGTGDAAITLGFEAKAGVLPLFRTQTEAWAKEHGLGVAEGTGEPETGSTAGGRRCPQAEPWARAQAPLDDCVDLAREWLTTQGGRIHAFLGQGTLQFEDPERPGEAETALGALRTRLGALGGHCEHPSLTPDPDAPQARWERDLLARLERIP